VFGQEHVDGRDLTRQDGASRLLPGHDVFNFSGERRRSGDGLLDVSHQISYKRQRISLIEDACREGTFDGGASAVPAGGFALRSRAASGIMPTGIRTGPGGAALDWDRRARVTPAETVRDLRSPVGAAFSDCALLPRPRKPGLKLSRTGGSPSGKSRGGTPTGERDPPIARRIERCGG